ncbi:hypothetical protein BGZ65_001473 [Modicella reniformis]|uniref:Uncharacterized protein n=1 Tax=Modicella reniformis TaxID=1440133 RepID=A0A9P6SU70_9FUNG|nr:hypothetical protein BGZ65_001473 [Modicella reniformis]
MLISIAAPGSTEGPSGDKSMSGAGVEGIQGSNNTGQPFLPAVMADLLDLDFTMGSAPETTESGEGGDESGTEAECPTKDKNDSDLSSAIEMILIDLSAPDPDMPSIPTSNGYIDSLFGSMDHRQIMIDLLGTTQDESTDSLTNHSTSNMDHEGRVVMTDGSNHEDLQELYSLKPEWQEIGNHSDAFSADSNSESDIDSDDSDATDSNDADPWKIIGDNKILLDVDSLDNIKKLLQNTGVVTWEDLFTQVKI